MMRRIAMMGRAVRHAPETFVAILTITLAFATSLFALLTARWLGPGDRGVVVVAMTTSSLLMLIGSLGAGTGMRVMFHHHPPLAYSRALKVSAQLSVVHLLTASVVGVGTLWLSAGRQDAWVTIAFVLFCVEMLYAYLLRQVLHGAGQHLRAIGADASTAAMQSTAVVVLYVGGSLDLNTVFLILLGGGGVQILLLYRPVAKLRGPTGSESSRLTHILRFSAPAMILSLGQAFVLRGDRLILGILSTPSTVGIYAAAATFSELLTLVPQAVGQVAFRRASVVKDAGSSKRERRTVLIASSVVALMIAAVARPLVSVLLGPLYLPAVPLIFVLLVAGLPLASYIIDSAVLSGLGLLRATSVVTTGGASVLLVGSLCLIPRYGAMGAALASLASYSVLAIGCRLLVSRHTQGVGKVVR